MTPVQTPIENRDLEWIKRSLQTAVELEYSTLPLYLSALFSLQVQNYSAYNLVRSVAMEEMVHMGIAANLLSAIGGTPAIRTLDVKYPTQGLPGGTEPDLFAGLAQFSKNQLKNFMRIERPAFLITDAERSEKYPTIGIFYTAIKDALRKNKDAVTAAVKASTAATNTAASKQVPDSIGLPKFIYDENVDTIEMLCAGIEEIMEQGEGTMADSIVTGAEYDHEESHYAKFASLYYGHAYLQPTGKKLTRENEPEFFKGPAVGWPEVMNIMFVPSDGYAKILDADPNGRAGNNVAAQLDAFDAAYSNMLTTLDRVWTPANPGTWHAIDQSAEKMINYSVFKNTAQLEQTVGGLGSAVHGMMDFRVFTSFNINKQQIPAEVIAKLSSLYPDEYELISNYTDLTKPVFYGPRFRNLNQ